MKIMKRMMQSLTEIGPFSSLLAAVASVLSSTMVTFCPLSSQFSLSLAGLVWYLCLRSSCPKARARSRGDGGVPSHSQGRASWRIGPRTLVLSSIQASQGAGTTGGETADDGGDRGDGHLSRQEDFRSGASLKETSITATAPVGCLWAERS